MSSTGKKARMQVLFCGRVQGVGFQWTVCRIAGSYDVVGSVRNLPNGDVELMAEGDKPELLQFLDAVRGSNLGRYIVKDQVLWTTAKGEFESFGILF